MGNREQGEQGIGNEKPKASSEGAVTARAVRVAEN
jgi:hypothetical protein